MEQIDEKLKKPDEKEKEYQGELRPHHIKAYKVHLENKEATNEEYLNLVKEVVGNDYADEFLISTRELYKEMDEDDKIKYVHSIDTKCKEDCNIDSKCKESEKLAIPKEDDDNAKEMFPELEFGKIYTVKELKDILTNTYKKEADIKEAA